MAVAEEEEAAPPRQPVHTRQIDCRGYRRADGLIDIEGRLTDLTADFAQLRFHAVAAGGAIHDMRLRMTIDLQMQIHRLRACTETGATPYCGGADAAYAGLEGLRIGPGFRRAVRERMGGARGCTHLTELLSTMAMTAAQTVLATLRDLGQTDRYASAGGKTHWIIDTCHAYRSDGPIAGTLVAGGAMAAQPSLSNQPTGASPHE